MVWIKYKKKKLIPIIHCWFHNQKIDDHAMFIYYHGIDDSEMNSYLKQGIVKKQYSLITDLVLSEEELYKAIKKNVRYEIRRSEKENVCIKFLTAHEMENNQELLSEFEKVYNQMYCAKGMKVEFNKELVLNYMKKEAIVFSIAFFQNIPLVFHSYIIDRDNARFFYSASPFREKGIDANMIARMNKFLHWQDICKFKQLGCRSYDWGGIHSPENQNGIDAFKFSFGGNCICYNNVIICNNVIKKIYSLIK